MNSKKVSLYIGVLSLIAAAGPLSGQADPNRPMTEFGVCHESALPGMRLRLQTTVYNTVHIEQRRKEDVLWSDTFRVASSEASEIDTLILESPNGGRIKLRLDADRVFRGQAVFGPRGGNQMTGLSCRINANLFQKLLFVQNANTQRRQQVVNDSAPIKQVSQAVPSTAAGSGSSSGSTAR